MKIQLPTIQGVLGLIKQKRQAATSEALRAKAPHTDPRIAHEAGVAADELAREADDLEGFAVDSADVVKQLEVIITHLQGSRFKSPARTLCLRSVEEASDRLRRELGSDAG